MDADERLAKVLARIEVAEEWYTKEGKPFKAALRGQTIVVRPLEGRSTYPTDIPVAALRDSFHRVDAFLASGRTPKVVDFTDDRWHSYAAAFYYDWSA